MRFRRSPLLFLTAMARDYGDVVRFHFGRRYVVLLNHPDDIRDMLVANQRQMTKSMVLQRARRVLGDGLLTSEGDLHLRQRRLAQPAFHRKRIAAYAETMIAAAAATGEQFPAGGFFDMHAAMMRLTLRIVGKTLFDADVEGDSQAVGDSLTALLRMFNFVILPFSEVLEFLPLRVTREMRAALAQLDTLIYRIIGERRRSGADHGDLLSMLLLAQDDEGDGRGMSDALVRDEALTIFLAGHETTATALSWAWYLLAQNPAAAAAFEAELDTVLGGRLPTLDDLPRLAYTRMALSEAMRLYPPAWIIGRQTTAEYALRGAVLPAGATLLASPFVTHHDERWFPEPYRFDPGRWTPEAIESRPKFAYYPFGGGTRICIGEQFAWMEGILLLATLGRNWRFSLDPAHPIEPQPLITLRPRFGLRMRAERRG